MRYLLAKFRFVANDNSHIVEDENIQQDASDLLCAMAGDVGFESFEETPDGVNGYIQETLFNRENIDGMLNEWPFEDIKIEYTIEEIAQQDWNSTWEEEGFEPIVIDDKICIYDARRGESPAIAKINIGIKAVNSFGTGTHETTQMVVGAMLNTDMNDKKVLDCGCGTGILSIVASKLGAREVVGYDIDEWCIENTKHNAIINNVENIRVMLGGAEVLSGVEDRFDVVAANINRNIIVADLYRWGSLMTENGIMILSGFFEEDVAIIEKEAKKYRLKISDCKVESGWACITLVYI